jgi:aspartyl-tRNA synthetase
MSDPASATPATGDNPQSEAPSKNALKKAQKEKEKVSKLANKRRAVTDERAGREESCSESS